MHITSFYKSWSGQEWLIPSVLSIYNHVDKIVILTSGISWIGGKENPSLEKIDLIKSSFDKENKVVHINYDEPDQLKHCDYGYKYIKTNETTDYVMLIDSDEVWDDKNMVAAKKFISENRDYNTYRVNMYTYIRNIFSRIDPPEPLKPVSFINTRCHDMGSQPRACTVPNCAIIPDAWMHHFVFVRKRFNNVLEKLIQSHVSEKQSYEDMSKWIPEVWNNIPKIPPGWLLNRGGFHPAIGYGKNWKAIKKVDITDLPEILQSPVWGEIKSWGN